MFTAGVLIVGLVMGFISGLSVGCVLWYGMAVRWQAKYHEESGRLANLFDLYDAVVEDLHKMITEEKENKR